MGRAADGIAAACAQASLASGTFRHGAVVLEGRKVVSEGFNHVRGAASLGLTSVHAEMDALWKLKRQKSSVRMLLVVVRLNKLGELAYSRPCEMCMRVLRRSGVHTVVYSTDDPHRARTEAIK